ncbi:cinnamycin family lantibiotic [Kineosporia sp. NBRC 101731]|uniref:cinnamycin family lantibiotic n=1 Tax=Kineosporia sp. NBRC 101731 TaxID=3032199 RepID=UPI0024A22EF0|nr:cinnamycin family lantibiotic [Kineosporia sp. NBRC 101731]GLY28764.1 hypothetical protein Kisp02_21290 [Kineosporia sp. NBRC 101731]
MNTTLLQQAAVDSEFRALIEADPTRFGVTGATLPAEVEAPDQESLDFFTEGVSSLEIYACESSCSFGPFTIVCDGGTK